MNPYYFPYQDKIIESELETDLRGLAISMEKLWYPSSASVKTTVNYEEFYTINSAVNATSVGQNWTTSWERRSTSRPRLLFELLTLGRYDTELRFFFTDGGMKSC